MLLKSDEWEKEKINQICTQHKKVSKDPKNVSAGKGILPTPPMERKISQNTNTSSSSTISTPKTSNTSRVLDQQKIEKRFYTEMEKAQKLVASNREDVSPEGLNVFKQLSKMYYSLIYFYFKNNLCISFSSLKQC